MDNALAQARNKLKKTEIVEESSKPSYLPSQLIVEDELEYERKMRLLDFHNWYPVIKEHTFRTIQFPLSKEECQAITAVYEKKNTVDPTILTRLEQKIDEKMKELREEIKKDSNRDTEAFFVKSSCRSPKDAAFYNPKTENGFRKTIEELRKTKKELTPNDYVDAVMRAVRDSFKVYNGKEALDMFLKSERIFEDIRAVFMTEKDDLDFYFVIREFRPIPHDLEFRAFCRNQKITALTQYDWFLWFERLESLRENTEKSLHSFYEKEIVPKLATLNGFPNEYVIDFAFVQNENGIDWNHPVVIEINPFHSSQPGLFSRIDDAKVLMGEEPFQFRLNNQPISDFRHISHEWRAFIEKHM
eukprot:TRINITY_DN6507_c0_g1_i1.p1 TRINITY_DN6507_c0_g1~~TRINITY_DN6507_c0_g1_i1.p1  ORF type:complete len:370 (-),score=101.99 TRINITY_DN6507_c0_g1_i1:105-1178(-)